MKTRQGFVSNSSSSSFIVRHINRLFSSKEKKCNKLSSKDIKKLLKYGFKETCISHPTHLDHIRDDSEIWKAELDENGKIFTKNFAYEVTCNQDEVINFLLKNDIGFIASIHYGHELCLFHKGDPHFMIFTNCGMEVETYHYDKKWEEIDEIYKNSKREKYYKVSVEEFLKEHENT